MVFQQDNAKVAIIPLGDLAPQSQPTVRLNMPLFWIVYNPLNPIRFNVFTVGPLRHEFKIFGEFHKLCGPVSAVVP